MNKRRVTLLLFALPAILIVAASVWLLKLSGGESRTALYTAECILLLAILWLSVYRVRMVKPISTLAGGINLLREQDFSSRLRHVGQPEADSIVDMFNDMMESLKRERLRIREQNHFLDLLIKASPMGIIVLDRDDRISMLNKAAAAFLDIDATDAAGLRPAEIAGPLAEAVASMQHDCTRTLRLNNSMVYRCSRLSYMDQGFAHPFILMEKLTDEVMRAERTAYEKVIRMMAHEVNNSMAGVNSILDTAAECVADSDISDALTACRRRCMSMSGFITSFADVVKIPEASLRKADLNEFTCGCMPMLESMCAMRGITLKAELASGTAETMIDPVLLEQVVINLVKNSAESIGADGHITLRVSSGPARLIVEDNGPGIDADTQAKIFSPFFSSKESGRGLGLLFVCDVLNKHKCSFSLRTDPDGMTRFTATFPNP